MQFDENNRQIYEKWVIYTVNNSGNFYELQSADLNCNTEAYTGDFNGDGLTDIFLLRYNKNTNKYFHSFLLSNISTGNFYYLNNLDIPDNFYPLGKNINIGDFTGNGKDDCFIYYNQSSGVCLDGYSSLLKIYSLNTDNNQVIPRYSLNSCLILYSSYATNFNGDGKADLMLISNEYGNNACRIVEYINGDLIPLYNSGYPTKDHRIFNGDFNGDGKTDILTWCESALWEIHLSKGNGYAWSDNPEVNFDHNNDPGQFYDDDNYIVADYNGDGKADILEQYDISGNQSRFNIFYSQGNTFVKETNDIPDIYPYIFQFNVNADFNGDGKQDCLLNTGYYTNPRKVVYFHSHEQKNLVKSITNGYNNKTQFEYKPITYTYDEFYTKGNGADFPVIDFQGALCVVENLTVPNGIGSHTTTQNYKYAGAKIHKQGKGFLGFMKVISENETTNIFSETELTYHEDYFNTYPVSTKTYYNSTSSLISSSTVLNQITQPLGNKRIFTYPKETENTNHLTNTTVSSNVTYDSNGNLTRSYVNYDDEGNTETLYQDYITAGAWLPTKPEKIIIKKTATGKPLYTRISDFEYYSNGLLLKSITDPGENKSITSEYWYNDFGYPTHTKISAPGEEDKDSYFEYDSKNRFVINQTDPLGFTIEKTYDEETGSILTETDINGHITKFKYDVLGSLIETELPDGIKSYQTKGWYENSGKTYAVTSADGKAPVTTYYDILGRNTRTESSGFKNETIISKTEYNSKGQVSKTYEPYFEGENGNSTTYIYRNDDGRISSIISPIGTTSYDYPGKTITVTMPDGEQTSKTINSLGQVLTAEDNGGTINYDYNSAGLPLTITAPGGAVVSIAYDNFGNKTSMTDPDAGTIYYTYDAFSNIKSQTDANQNMYEMEYDIAGRITEKSGPEGVTTYVYDTASNGLGMLASEQVTPVGNRQVYTYDNLSRLSSVTETFENEDYTYSYNYDNFGRINRMTYPSGFAYTKHYKPDNGYLEHINREDNGDLIWKAEDMNALGQLTQYCKGVNEITTYKTYDDYHRPEAVVTGDFQHFEYYFEKETGNLLNREDVIHSNKESFEYDDNRLHKIWQGYTPALVNTINFDNPTGNISSKTDAGTYSYDANKIHAVTKVTGDEYLPSDNQDITYTAFNKVKEIRKGFNKGIPGVKLTFTYDLNNQRKKTVANNNGNIAQTKYFFGSYEKTINNFTGEITEYNFLPGGAIYKETDGTGEMLFTYTDYLGSITHITDDQGNLIAEQSFDAWGRIRNADDWTYENASLSGIINRRGYTGHEMLPTFGIINMNGRLYDPVLGRMLSPDNYIQAPDFTQNFNRYSYVLNNPLKYVDPSGEWVAELIGAIIGQYLGGVVANGGQLNPLQWNWSGQDAWKTYVGMGVGAALGALGGYYMTNPGSLQVAANIITPVGTVGAVGQGSNWSLQWTTDAGGGGQIPLGNNQPQNTSVMVQNQINQSVANSSKWNGPYYQGTEEEAAKLAIELSILFGVEISFWSTDRGYYFEPIQGDTYTPSYNSFTDELYTTYVSTGYKKNTIKRAYIYTPLDNSDYYIWLCPNMFQKARIQYHAHIHPSSSPPGKSDHKTMGMLGIEGRVFGWNGAVYRYWWVDGYYEVLR